MSADASSEDTSVWVGRIAPGHAAEHAQFIEWLNGPDAAAIFRRRRLREYLLTEEDGMVTVVFRTPRTGDPRLTIDFLRYPGLWPAYWAFVRGGRDAAPPAPAPPASSVKVHWRPDAAEARA